MEWDSPNSFSIDGYKFFMPDTFAKFERNVKAEENYSDNVFLLGKNLQLIRLYLSEFHNNPPKNVVEIGVFRGGSVGFMQLAVKPEKLLALEFSSERQEFLDQFIAHEKLENNVRVYYGIDQADSAAVGGLTKEFLGEGRCIDCVMDDASHLLTPTRSSFDTLFPLLRPGGSFIIEDYAAAQTAASSGLHKALGGTRQERDMFNILLDNSLQADRQPLHLMGVEAMLASITNPGIVRRVVIDRHWLKIIRGPDDIDPTSSFSLRDIAEDHYSLLNSAPDEKIITYLREEGLLN